MGNVTITEVTNKKLEKEFIKVPWRVYDENSSWVPPLIGEAKRTIEGKNNTYKKCGPSVLAVAYKDEAACGRICVGINQNLNGKKGYRQGYIALFECIDDDEVARELLEFAYEWLKDKGMDTIIGPLSLPDGDDCRGILIDNFDNPPQVMNIYNPPYYKRFFEENGFKKYWDCYAYNYDISLGIQERYSKVTEFAKAKYGFRVDPIDLKNIDREKHDIKKIIEKAMPEEWDDFVPPNDEEIDVIVKNIVPVADPGLILIARDSDDNPIGFDLALPDYNQALRYMNGRLFPIGFIKFIHMKKHIDRMRLFTLFVVPEWRKKGVSSAIYYELYKACVKRGYISGEGSTIWEYNDVMQREVEKTGAVKYKTYRIYKKDII